MVDDSVSLFIPLVWIDVYVGGYIRFPSALIKFYLYQSLVFRIEFLFSVEYKSIFNFIHVLQFKIWTKVQQKFGFAIVVAASVSQISTLIPSGVVYESVDLGLPSGTKWARFNIGATIETDYGDLFAWGATGPYIVGRDNTNNYSSSKASTIQHDLLPYEDAATILWGSGWLIPTKAQFEELIANTTNEWVTINSINGRKFTASNGNYIFIPAAGNVNGGSLANRGSYGRYWSRSFNSASNAWILNFNSSEQNVNADYRSRGFSVRPVKA